MDSEHLLLFVVKENKATYWTCNYRVGHPYVDISVGYKRLCESYLLFSELQPDLEVDFAVQDDLLYHYLYNLSEKPGIVSLTFNPSR